MLDETCIQGYAGMSIILAGWEETKNKFCPWAASGQEGDMPELWQVRVHSDKGSGEGMVLQSHLWRI